MEQLYDDIVFCLTRYGGLQESDAHELLNGSKLFDKAETEAGRIALVHETGYYWAMCLLHGRESRWFDNPTLWPPPKDYYDPDRFLRT